MTRENNIKKTYYKFKNNKIENTEKCGKKTEMQTNPSLSRDDLQGNHIPNNDTIDMGNKKHTVKQRDKKHRNKWNADEPLSLPSWPARQPHPQ